LETPYKPGLDFVALDVETANSQMDSICQIGYCQVENGQIVGSKSYLVNPCCDFTNSYIHGIGPETVADSPNFPEVIALISADLEGKIIVHHTHFDRIAFVRAAELHGLQLPKSRWLDSAQFMRNIFPRYSERGYGLEALCNDYGVIQTSHHQAEDDAICLAQVFISALDEAGLMFTEITQNRKLRGKVDGLDIIKTKGIGSILKAPEVIVRPAVNHAATRSIVFTGDFSVPREELEMLATTAGFAVRKGISKVTNFLVVRTPRDVIAPFYQASQKAQKAEELNAGGASIQLISEDEFYDLIGELTPTNQVNNPIQQAGQDLQVNISSSDPQPSTAGESTTDHTPSVQAIAVEQQSKKRRNIFQSFRKLHIVIRILIIILIIGLLFICSALSAGMIQALQEIF